MAISQSTISHSDGSVDIAIVVPFIVPGLPAACKASKPIVDQITASVATTGGTLTGGQSVYYHFTAVDSLGAESVPSEPIEVIIPSGTNTNKVTLLANNNPFDSNTSTFNVYRSLVAPTGDGTPANNPQQASSGNTPPASCAALTLTDTGSAISGGGGGAGSGNPPPSQLYIKTRVYYQLPGESIWRLGAETNDASQTSLTFHLPHNIQGQQINIQLRNVFRNGYETPASLAPTKSYTITAAYPTGLGIGAPVPPGSIFGKSGVGIIDNSGGTGLDSVIEGVNFNRIKSSHVSSGVAYNFKGVWSSATAYVVGDEVVYQANYWLCLIANSNSAPATGNTNWQVVGSYSSFLGAWSSTTNYVAGAEVTYNGNFWVCVTANTNSAPTTSNANWQIAGPVALDNVADGNGAGGGTYQRMPIANMDSNRRGLIDFTQSGHLSKNLANVADDTASGRSASRWFFIQNSNASAEWRHLGTWVFNNYGDALRIEYTGGRGFNSNTTQQSHGTIIIRSGDSDGINAPNISGVSWYENGGGNGAVIASVKVSATGGSTSPNNLSWEIYVQVNPFANGHWEVVLTPGSTFTWSGVVGSDPGAASTTVVVGTGGLVLNTGGTGLDAVNEGVLFNRIKATHVSGNVAYNFKGAWSSATSYVIGDEVTFGNIYWIALAANSNSQPSISNGNWQAVGRIQGDVQIFTSSGTWSKPAAGTFAIITVIGGGGGGASGEAENTGTALPGGGGGQGGFSYTIVPLSILGSTETVTIGAGGAGGVAVSPNSSGNAGGNGGASSFGNWLQASGGQGGFTAGSVGASGNGNIAAGAVSLFPGAGGKGGQADSGGGFTSGTAGVSGATARVTSYAGGGGGAGSATTNGSPGGVGANASTDEVAGGGGGGGGGGCSDSGNAGNGGNAGNYGAGGGGGGGLFSTVANSSGAGGAGAPGLVVIAVY